MPRIASDTEVSMRNSESTISLSARSEDHMLRLQEMRFDDEMRTRQHEREQEAREAEIRKITAANDRMKLQLSEEGKQAREEHRMKLEEMRCNDEMKARQHEQEQEARETEIRKITAENERLKLQLSAEGIKAREYDGNIKLQEQEHKKEMMREAKEMLELIMKFERETAARKSAEVEILKSEEEISRQRFDERRIETEEKQRQFDEKIKRCEQLELERQFRQEDDTRRLRNLGLVTAGVATTSGAISGALGATAAAGLAAGVAVGAATVLAPVTGIVAILSGAAYVYKNATSSNRA